MFDATLILVLAISFVFAVILAVLDVTLFDNANSAAVALDSSAEIAATLAETRFESIAMSVGVTYFKPLSANETFDFNCALIYPESKTADTLA